MPWTRSFGLLISVRLSGRRVGTVHLGVRGENTGTPLGKQGEETNGCAVPREGRGGSNEEALLLTLRRWGRTSGAVSHFSFSEQGPRAPPTSRSGSPPPTPPANPARRLRRTPLRKGEVRDDTGHNSCEGNRQSKSPTLFEPVPARRLPEVGPREPGMVRVPPNRTERRTVPAPGGRGQSAASKGTGSRKRRGKRHSVSRHRLASNETPTP